MEEPNFPVALSERQQRLLTYAIDDGYFAVPRETTLLDLSDKTGLSDVEAAEELRRSIDSILELYLENAE